MCREPLPTERVGRGASCRTWTKPLLHLHGATLHASRQTRGRDLPPVYGARSLHACSRAGAHAGPRGQYEGACEVANIAHAPSKRCAPRSQAVAKPRARATRRKLMARVLRPNRTQVLNAHVSCATCRRGSRGRRATTQSAARWRAPPRRCTMLARAFRQAATVKNRDGACARANNARSTVVLGKTCLARASVSEDLPLHQ